MPQNDYYQVRVSIPFDHPIYGALARYLDSLGRGSDAKALVFLGAVGHLFQKGGQGLKLPDDMSLADEGLLTPDEMQTLHQQLDEEAESLFG